MFKRLAAQGWTDALGVLHPEAPLYTFWDYKRRRFDRDEGLRIDHLLMSPTVAGRLRRVGVDREVRSWDGASDHAPAWMEFGRGASARGKTSG